MCPAKNKNKENIYVFHIQNMFVTCVTKYVLNKQNMKKLAHSVVPIRVYVGCFEYRFLEVDREFKLDFYKYILDYTTMFLLSYKVM